MILLFAGSPEGWNWDHCETQEWNSSQSHRALLDLPNKFQLTFLQSVIFIASSSINYFLHLHYYYIVLISYILSPNQQITHQVD